MVKATKINQEWEWNLVKLSVLIFPLLPELGGIGLLLTFLSILKKHSRQLIQFPLNRGLLILTIWLVFTTCLSPRPLDAFLGLGNFLPFFFIFIHLGWLIQKPSQLRQLTWCLVIPSLIIVTLGLGQLFWGWGNPIWLEKWPNLQSILVPYGRPAGRMSSVFMYANILAIYLLLTFILSWGLWINTYQTLQQRKSKQIVWKLVFLSFTVVMNGIGLILTYSRNAWGLAFLACLVFAIYLGWRWLVIGISILVSSIAIASWGTHPIRDIFRRFIPAYFWARLSDEIFENRPIATLRSTQWQFAWDMTLQRPLIGWGLRNFTPLYQSKMGLWLGHPHNLFLMLMAETGIIGLLLFCSWVGWIYWQGIQLLNDAKISQGQLLLFTYLVAFGGCTLFNIFDVTILDGKVNTISWIVLSAIGGIVTHSRKTVGEI